MRIVEGMVMVGGWHFKDGPVTINSNSYQELIDDVTKWRLENGRASHNTKNDVDNYICATSPQNCKGAKGNPAPRQSIGYRPPAQKRFVDFLIDWAKSLRDNSASGAQLETEHEAVRRGNTCIQCKMNEKWEDSCPKCVDHARRLFVLIRQNKDVPMIRHKLHGCVKMNFCVRTAVWIKREFLGKRDDLPKDCWLR